MPSSKAATAWTAWVVREPDPDRPCRCSSCEWGGAYKELLQITSFAAFPGDFIPAGRCPSCKNIAYPYLPEKPAAQWFVDMRAAALRRGGPALNALRTARRRIEEFQSVAINLRDRENCRLSLVEIDEQIVIFEHATTKED